MNFNTDDFNDIKTYPFAIGENKYNINRPYDNNIGPVLFTDFNDAILKKDEKNGSHLEFKYEKGLSHIMPYNDQEKERFDSRNEFIQKLVGNTFSYGYETPSPIQRLCIPELIKGTDCIVQSKSGTGKTHAFCFGTLWNFDPNNTNLQFIYMTTSHEVANQIFNHVKMLVGDDSMVALCIGHKIDKSQNGSFKSSAPKKTLKEERAEYSKARILVCTIGKFYNYFVDKKIININEHLKAFCVDEFDNIVTAKSHKSNNGSSIMSTEDQMYEIVQRLPTNTQRVFFSATGTGTPIKTAFSYFRKYSPARGEPFIVTLDEEDFTLEGIRQYYVACPSTAVKEVVMFDLLQQCRVTQCIVFVNRIEMAYHLKEIFDCQKIPVTSEVFHGGLPDDNRKKIHKDFLMNKFRLLISTDVTSRGLDIPSINLVINFDMPNDLETYIHRAGRGGRYGRKGVCISLIIDNEEYSEQSKVNEINLHSKQSKMIELPENLADLL